MLTVAAIDLDDTLLRSDGSISVRTLAALQSWREKGNRIVIATGRPRRTITTVLPVELCDAPVISYNGAEIHVDGNKRYANLIPAVAARAIVERCLTLAPEAEIGVEIDNVLYLNRISKRPRQYEVGDLLELTHQPCAKVLIFADELAVLEPMLAALPIGARALYSGRYRFIQILGETVDKAEALRFLVAEWGLTMENVVAFGDDTNDVDMVRMSGLGVAVSNAVAEVLAVAHRVTASNDEDGVALILEELLKI